MEIQNANIIRAILNGIVIEDFKRDVKIKILRSEVEYNPMPLREESTVRFELDTTDFNQYLKEEKITYPIYGGAFAFVTDRGTFSLLGIDDEWKLLNP